MMTSKQAIMLARRNARHVHQKYYNTTHYIAIVVTIILFLQVWWMMRGHG